MRRCILPALVLLSLSACATRPPGAEAIFKPAKGNSAAGTVTFVQQGDKVRIRGQFTGLTPGAHGFHIHEKDDCSPLGGTNPDRSSAGAHFNPFGKRHGDPSHPAHHAGDLPMLVAGASGQARFDAFMDGISLGIGQTSILNRSIVVHAQPDDFTTQPAGNSGPVVACGVIKAR